MSGLWSFIKDQRNKFDFNLRKMLRWQRGGLQFKNQSKSGMFDYLSLEEQHQAQKLAERLITEYKLEYFFNHSTKINFRENLFYLSILEKAFSESGMVLNQKIRVADVGPAHWFYVQALFSALTWWNSPEPRSVDLTGFEIDAFRLFSSFYSTYDYAMAHIRSLPVQYRPAGFQTQANTYDLITMFFPFVFDNDHQNWGLPHKEFDPVSLRLMVKNSLKPDGYLLVVNQGEKEHQQEVEYLNQCKFRIIYSFEQNDLLYRYDLKRFVILAGIKNES